jgi:thioredoxin-dependent peroxiredoxin
MSRIGVGDRAPDFELSATSGETVKLSSFAGKKAVVLFFYPKDDSYGCTAEACDFRDNHAQFAKAGAEVLGVSADSIASHKRFADKHRLPMTLLSDPDNVVRKSYGVKATLGLLPGRVTFVIDREGVVRYVYSSQLRFTQHVQNALGIVKEITRA